MTYKFYLARPDRTTLTSLTTSAFSKWTDVEDVDYIELEMEFLEGDIKVMFQEEELPFDQNVHIHLGENRYSLKFANMLVGSIVSNDSDEVEKTARMFTALHYIKSEWALSSNKLCTLFLASGIDSATKEFGYPDIVDSVNSKGFTVWIKGTGYVRPKFSIQDISFKYDHNLNLIINKLSLVEATT